MVLTNFNGAGIGFGFGVGCGFGVGWGFGVAINCSGWEERWLYQPGRQAFLFNSEFSSLYILCTYFRYHQGFIDNKMEKDRVFTSSQVAEHKSSKDIWFTINGRVLDVTKFLEEHPGGEEVLIEYAGKDATKGYEAIGHSKGAHNLLSKFQVGYLEGYSRSQPDTQSNEQLEKVRAMEAFVIKDDPEQKHSFLIEFLVPALVAALYFGYRCMTGAVFFGS